MFTVVFLYFLPLPPLPFCQAPFILFQGHAGGVSTSPSAHPKLLPSLLPGLVPERRNPEKSPVRSGGGGAHARAGLGGGGEEELPEVGGRGGGRAGASCLGNRGAGLTTDRRAGQTVVSVSRTQEGRESPLPGLRVSGPAASSGLWLFPKPARGRRIEGLQSGGRARLKQEGARGRRRGLSPAQEVPLGGGPGVLTSELRQRFLGAKRARCPLPPPAPWP